MLGLGLQDRCSGESIQASNEQMPFTSYPKNIKLWFSNSAQVTDAGSAIICSANRGSASQQLALWIRP